MEFTNSGAQIRSVITEEGEVPYAEWRARQDALEEEDEDEEDEDYYHDPLDPVGTEYGYEGTLIDDDIWEDRLKFAGIRAKYPTQHIMKVMGYTARTFADLDDWLAENCQGQYKRVGWASGCSTTVAVVFWDTTDAILYRMRWQ